MSSSDRVRKHRYLKNFQLDESNSDSDDNESEKNTFANQCQPSTSRDVYTEEIQSFDVSAMRDGGENEERRPLSCSDMENEIVDSYSSSDYQRNTSESSQSRTNNDQGFVVQDDDRDELLQGNINDKLVTLIHRNIACVTQKFVDELLLVLRSENHTSLPKSSKTLLNTSKYRSNTRPMLSGLDTYGQYTYYGIHNTLKNIVSPDVFTECEIQLLTNVDGADIHNKSNNHIWPILGMIDNRNYNTKPFLIALYYGDSKPNSAREFLEDFVNESNHLITNGIIINDVHYNFNIKAFICDTPARAFLKRCKGHTGFFSCERCEIKGETIRIQRHGIVINKNKRIFQDINCVERTNESFRNRSQASHHLNVEISPLIDIIGFDVVKFVLLDPMHLLCLGVSKNLLLTLINGNREYRIGIQNVLLLQEMFNNISKDMTMEFQRYKFNLCDIPNLKATQFRFFLLYCSGLFLEFFLPRQRYEHFMLLFVAVRILSSKELALQHAQYAKELLRKFVSLMPRFWGEDSVTITFHNLIHIADDVLNMHDSLFQYSAFAFEDCIRFIKELPKGTKNPLSQISKRLFELQEGNVSSIHNRYPLIHKIQKYNELPVVKIKEHREDRIIFSQVDVGNMKIKSSHPNNIIQLKNRNFLKIEEIFSNPHNVAIGNIFIRGIVCEATEDVFNFPLPSREVGIVHVREILEQNVIVRKSFFIEDISKKCMLTNINEKPTAINLLHV